MCNLSLALRTPINLCDYLLIPGENPKHIEFEKRHGDLFYLLDWWSSYVWMDPNIYSEYQDDIPEFQEDISSSELWLIATFLFHNNVFEKNISIVPKVYWSKHHIENCRSICTSNLICTLSILEKNIVLDSDTVSKA